MNCPSICKRKLWIWAPKSGFFINLQSRRTRGDMQGTRGQALASICRNWKNQNQKEKSGIYFWFPQIFKSSAGSNWPMSMPRKVNKFPFCHTMQQWHTLKRWQKPDSPLTPHSQGKGGDKYWGHGCIYNFMFNLGDQSEIQSTILEVRSQRFHDKRILNFQEFHGNQSDCFD